MYHTAFSPMDTMLRRLRAAVAGSLTAKYVLALVVLAILALVNHWALREQIRAVEAVIPVVEASGQQRQWLERSVLLARRLVTAEEAAERDRIRQQLQRVSELLEQTHHQLIGEMPDHPKDPPQMVQTIYYEAPWLLDTEMRNYVVQLRALAAAEGIQLGVNNPHFRYIREAATAQKMIEGLDAVVGAYRQQSLMRAARLHRLAQWSVGSTLVVLLLTALLIFRPMVQRVRQDMVSLTELNQTLEQRVAERSAVAEQQAGELAISEARLREQSRILQSVLDGMGDGVIVADRDHRILLLNPAARRMLNVDSVNELPETWSNDWTTRHGVQLMLPDGKTPYPNDQLPLFHSSFEGDGEGTGNGGNGSQLVNRAEIFLKRTRSPHAMWVSSISRPLQDEQGFRWGVVTVLRDVTERKEAEKRLLQSERLAAIGQMVAGVAHESRNAMQQMQACTQLLCWELEGSDLVRELLEDLQKAQDRLHRLFEDLRHYAAPMELELRLADVRSIVQEAWQLLARCRQDREAVLLDHGNGLDLRCKVDPFQLEQVFRNVLENALDACQDPVRLEVAYCETRLDGQPAVEVAIRDNGPGMSGEQAERIFEPFYTTKTKGTGLGMAIVKRIVQSHGGRIEVAPANPSGTEIVITLPRGKQI